MKIWCLFRPTGRTSARRGLLPALAMLALPLIGFTTTSQAQIGIPALGTPVSENFNLLAASGTSSTVPPGWAFLETLANANGIYTAGAGSSNAGDTYSFGSAGSNERAFGELRSANLVTVLGAGYRNTTGRPIHQIQVDYTGEQWRLGTLNRPDQLDFQYSLNATSLNTGTWIDVDPLDFLAPTTGPTTGALDGNAAANRRAISFKFPVSIPNSATIWIRWTGFDAANADDGLAIDDVSVTASQVTTTTLTVAPPQTFVGEKVSLVAQVSPVPPAGKVVNFIDGAVIIGTSPIDSSGHATLSISTLAVGAHSLIAEYPGNTGTKPSRSNNVPHEVNALPPSDLSVVSVCTTDSLKNCSHIVFTNQPWHILFVVRNVGQKVVDHWSYDINLYGPLGSFPIKTQVDGPPVAVGGTTTINWPSPYIFSSDQKGDWQIEVVAKIKDAGNPDGNPNDNRANATFVVANKPPPPPSDIAVDYVCAADSSKTCSSLIYTNQPWHILFTVRNTGQKPVDNWSFDIALEGAANLVLKSQVAGGPLAVGSTQTISWPSPYLFDTSQKGTWRVTVSTKINDPTNPDADSTNNSGSATFLVQNKGGGQPSDIAIRIGCVTLGGGGGAPQGPGLCVPFNDQASFRAYNQDHGKIPKGIETFEEALIAPGGKSCFPGPLGSDPNLPAFPNGLSERNLIIQDNVTPTPDPPYTNPSGSSCALHVVAQDYIGASSAKVGEDLFLQGRPASLDLIFTEPGHTGVGFKLSRFPGYPAAGWHITVYDRGGAITGTFEVADSVVQEPNKSFFGVWCHETIGRINIFDRSPVPAPDAIDDIEMWTQPGILKVCTDTLFTGQPWHTDFVVANEGLKPIDNWSFDIVLVGPAPGQVIPIKTQVAGQPLPVGAILPLNWESPYVFSTDQKGPWRVVVTVKIKDASNPDSDPTDNQIGIPFVVINKPSGETTDLGIGYSCVTDSSKSCSSLVYTNQPWHTLFRVMNNGTKPVDNWSYDIVLQHGLGAPPIPLKTQIPGPPISPGGVITINWPSPHLFTSDEKGLWTVTLAIKVKDPTNPDVYPGNNQVTITFEVQNKAPQVTNIGVPSVCVADSTDSCRVFLFTYQAWSAIFTVANGGLKIADAWAFDLDLYKVGTAQHIIVKTQVGGPPLPVGGSTEIHWPGPIFLPDDEGDWDIVATAKVKDPTNPDTDPSDNTATARFRVRSPITATLLSLFEAAPGDGGLRLRWQFVDPGEVTNVDAQRAPAVTGPWSRIGADRRDESGVTVLVDRGIEAGATYYYRLVATLRDGESQTFGPIMASAKGAITAFALSRISPNPSFGSTRIEFAVPRESNIRLSVMDLQGREVAVLADGPSHPGVFHATWNGRTFRGDAPAGLYFINLRTPEGSIVRRLALTK